MADELDWTMLDRSGLSLLSLSPPCPNLSLRSLGTWVTRRKEARRDQEVVRPVLAEPALPSRVPWCSGHVNERERGEVASQVCSWIID